MKKRYQKILQKYNKDKSRFLQVYAGIDLYRWGIPLFIHYVPIVGVFGIRLFRAHFLCFLLEIEWMKLYIEKGDKDGKN